jgi:hypothetical protein
MANSEHNDLKTSRATVQFSALAATHFVGSPAALL